MKRLPIVYAVLTLTVLGLGLAVALAVHRAGSAAVLGWRDIARPGDLSARHAFLQGECEACHTPYRGVEATNCILCHVAETTLLAQQSTSFHAQAGECRGCHIEHQGPAVRPTRMDHDVLVQIGSRALASETGPLFWTRALARLSVNMGAAASTSSEATLDCFGCHANRDPHRELLGRGCADCHAVEAWRISDYRHPSSGSQDCAQCHQAPPSHYMMHFQMVSVRVARQMHARVEQCYLCHQTDSWNSIKGVGWYKHH